MFQFLQPILLLAGTTIVVPIVIHLRREQKVKTLKVGSIMLFPESARTHAKSLRLTEWLLLLLRCLLLILLALAIAKPFYHKESAASGEKGWLMIEKTKVQEAYRHYKPLVDSLLTAGYSFHYFSPQCEKASFADALKTRIDTVVETPISYWALLKEVNSKIPPQVPVYLFTDNRLTRFTGNRPTISFNLNWSIFRQADSTADWIEKAFMMHNDSIRVITGKSTLYGTSYASQNIAGSGAGERFVIDRTDGQVTVGGVAASGSTFRAMTVDTSSIHIVVYSKATTSDVKYLEAAINAVQSFTKYSVFLSVVSTIQSIPQKYDWLFWLSEETMPGTLKHNAIFTYANGVIENRLSAMSVTNIPGSTTEDIPVFKWIKAENNNHRRTTIWRNNFGDPLLTVDQEGATIYRFYSRFDPQWNDLPWDNRFPELIYNVLYNSPDKFVETSRPDKRIIDVAQISPVTDHSTKASIQQERVIRTDLSLFFWVIAFILFIIERIVAFASQKEAQNE